MSRSLGDVVAVRFVASLCSLSKPDAHATLIGAVVGYLHDEPADVQADVMARITEDLKQEKHNAV